MYDSKPSLQAHDEHIDRLKRRFDALKGGAERVNFETHAQEVSEVCSPRKNNFVGQVTPGEKKMRRIYDPIGITAVDMLAAGLHGMATNPAAKWFSLRMVGERVKLPNGEMGDLNDAEEVQKYLSDVEEIMWQRVYAPGTNFTTAMHEVYQDLSAFGNAVLFVGQQENGALLFECRPLAECVFDENMDGKVDSLFRMTEYTVRQLCQMERAYGWKLSQSTQDKARDEQWSDKVKVIHAVCPRQQRDPSKKDAENMEWMSTYFEHEECHLLYEKGFPEFPYQVARWSKYSGEVYGRGPGMTALPDLKMLQAMSLKQMKLIDKAADPPMWLRHDGVVGQTRTVPGGINYWRGNPNEGVMLQPVSLQGVQFLAEAIGRLKEQILQTFYADLLRMADRANMTATEVIQRTQEMMRLLGPLVGRLESEMLGPLVNRVFGLLNRENLLPKPPKIIQGRDFVVEYVSPIATAQKQAATSGIMQVMQIISVFGPEAAMQIAGKNLDVDKLFRSLWDQFNNDPDHLRSEQELAQLAQMEQAQQAMQMAQPGVDMAAQGAGAIKDLAQGAQAAQGAIATEGGMDMNQLMAQFAQNMQDDPKAMAELRQMMSRGGDMMADNMPAGMGDEPDAEFMVDDAA